MAATNIVLADERQDLTLRSVGVREEGGGLGKMISCYSASWCLALNFDGMAEDRAAFLQLLNSKIKNHTPRRAEWENRNSFKIIKFLRNGDIDPGIEPRFPALQADSLPSG